MYTKHDAFAICHAFFACSATSLVIPASILIARWGRHNPIWFRLHMGLNLLTCFLLLGTYALGGAAVMIGGHGSQYKGKGSDVHHQMGLTVFLMVFAQTALGFWAHRTSSGGSSKNQELAVDDKAFSDDKKDLSPASSALPGETSVTKKSFVRYFHIFFALLTVIGLNWLCWDGMHTEWNDTADSGTEVPLAVKVVFGIVTGLGFVAYIAGAAKALMKRKN